MIRQIEPISSCASPCLGVASGATDGLDSSGVLHRAISREWRCAAKEGRARRCGEAPLICFMNGDPRVRAAQLRVCA